MRLGKPKDPNTYYNRLTPLKKLFWLYFLLLIFEGALRKWIVPPLSAPLLVVRDPVGIAIVWEAYRTHKWPARWTAATSLLTVGFVCLCLVQIIAGDNPWFVGLYGLRSYLLPFPVAFAMGENLDAEDLRRMGAFIIWILAPMALLEVLQYRSSPSAFLNRGSYEGAAQIGYTVGRVRAAGTFSFSTGAISFGILAGAFLFYGLVKPGLVKKKWLLWVGAAALVLSVPVCGARAFLYMLGAELLCVAISAALGVTQFVKTLRILVPIVLMGVLVSFLPIFSEATHSFTERFTQAEHTEGNTEHSMIDRIVGPVELTLEFTDYASHVAGEGMGRGAAAMEALIPGSQQFETGEDELSRLILELGPLPATAFELFILILAAGLLGRAIARARDHEPLALLLMPLALSSVLFGVLENPTEDGFIVISMAFALAAIRLSAPEPIAPQFPVPQWNPVRRPRTRRSIAPTR